MAADDERRILLGHIAGAHGIRGEVVIKTYTGEPEAIADYGALETDDLTRSIELRVVAVTPKGVVARVKGVSDRNGAEALKGTALYVERTRLPEAEDGSYYYTDLIGLTAEAPDGQRLGSIVAVHNFGAGDILELAMTATGKTELVPFTDAFVPAVDIAEGRVVVALPAPAEEDTGGTAPDEA